MPLRDHFRRKCPADHILWGLVGLGAVGYCTWEAESWRESRI